MNKSKTYSPEVRERAVRMVFEHAPEYPSQWAAIQSSAEKIGCSGETLRSWVRRAERLVHHSDRGSQYLSIRYSERLAEAGIEPSVGSKGDSYDCDLRGTSFQVLNALAESVIGLFKTEMIRQRGPWRGLEDVEFATLEWVWWFNHHRLLEPFGYVPPVEYEEAFYRRHETQPLVPALTN
jgi:putative transposase